LGFIDLDLFRVSAVQTGSDFRFGQRRKTIPGAEYHVNFKAVKRKDPTELQYKKPGDLQFMLTKDRIVLQHVELLLGNDLETNNGRTFCTRQKIIHKQLYRAITR
jgi:hypothetical protein